MRPSPLPHRKPPALLCVEVDPCSLCEDARDVARALGKTEAFEQSAATANGSRCCSPTSSKSSLRTTPPTVTNLRGREREHPARSVACAGCGYDDLGRRARLGGSTTAQDLSSPKLMVASCENNNGAATGVGYDTRSRRLQYRGFGGVVRRNPGRSITFGILPAATPVELSQRAPQAGYARCRFICGIPPRAHECIVIDWPLKRCTGHVQVSEGDLAL